MFLINFSEKFLRHVTKVKNKEGRRLIMSFLNTQSILCPYCSQQIEVLIDCSVKMQKYVEDCEVCCRPILISIKLDENNEINIEARQENE